MWNRSRVLGGSRGSDLSLGSDEFIGSGGPYVNAGSGGFGRPYVYDGSGGSGGSRSSGSNGYHGSGDSGSGGSGSGSFGEPYVYDGSGGSGGFRGFGGSHGSNSNRRSDGYIDGYFVTLAGLWGWTIAQLEQHTRVKASVEKTLPGVAAFYQHAGYSDSGYQEFDTRDQLKKYLSQVFTNESESTASHQRKFLRMILAAGWMHSMEPSGHMVVLNCWPKNGELIIYQALDYTFDGDRRKATKRALPQDREVKSFFCFEPIFYFESTDTNSFNPDLY